MKITDNYETLFQKINFNKFLAKFMKILDRAFCIFLITLGRVDPDIDPTIKRSQIEASRII